MSTFAKIAYALTIMFALQLSGCSANMPRDEFEKFAGFKTSKEIQIVGIENPNYESDSIGYEANFKISGPKTQIENFCKQFNFRFFEKNSNECAPYSGYSEVSGNSMIVSNKNDGIYITFTS